MKRRVRDGKKEKWSGRRGRRKANMGRRTCGNEAKGKWKEEMEEKNGRRQQGGRER